jgi:hypothetical protein
MSRRHPPRVELGVGTALLVGGLGFLLVSLFAGFSPAWSFVGGVAAMTGAAKSYRAGRDLQEQRHCRGHRSYTRSPRRPRRRRRSSRVLRRV